LLALANIRRFTVKPIFLSAALMMSAAAAAQACPDYRLGGDVDYSYTGDILLREREYSVQIGTDYSLVGCGHQYPGYVSAAPTTSFRLARMDHYPLEIRVEAPCDSVLLVNAANGDWYYNDDGPYGHNPQINLRGSATLNGRVDIWVGSYDGQSCFGDLILETER
jgi:hypothetical protein